MQQYTALQLVASLAVGIWIGGGIIVILMYVWPGQHQPEIRQASHVLTPPEVRDRLIDEVANWVNYYEEWPTDPAWTESRPIRDLAYMVMGILDGSNIELPPFLVIPDPYPEVNRKLKEQQDECFPEADPGLRQDSVSGELRKRLMVALRDATVVDEK